MTPLFANSAEVKVTEKLVLRGGAFRKLRLQIRYGIVIHPTAGLTLIDTGYGPRTTKDTKRSWALRLYNWLIGVKLEPEGSLDGALSKLGYTPDDVTHVILTHFHADHVSELYRLPNARVFMKKSAFDAVQGRPNLANYRHGIFPELLPADLPNRLIDISSLNTVQAPLDLGIGHDIFGDGSVISVDLPGHAEGHFGLCFPQNDTPLLYAVDVQWMINAVSGNRIPKLASRLVAKNFSDLETSARRVKEFCDKGGEMVLCHDPAPTRFDLSEQPDV